MKDLYTDKTKSNLNFVSTQNSFTDKINSIKYKVEINNAYNNNLSLKNKMKILPTKSNLKKLSSLLDFKVVGGIMMAIIILSTFSLLLIYICKTKDDNKEDKKYYKLNLTLLYNKNNTIKLFNPNNLGLKENQIEVKKLEENLNNFIEEYNINYLGNGYINISSKEKGFIKVEIYFYTPFYNINNMFEGCKDLIIIDFSNIGDLSITNMSETFKNCTNLEKINFKSLDTSKVKSMYSLFEGCNNLVNIEWLENLNTSSVNNIERMFYNCDNLINISLPFFNLDNFTEIFLNNTSLTIIDLKKYENIKNILNLDNNNFYNIFGKDREINIILKESEFNQNINTTFNKLFKISQKQPININCIMGSKEKCYNCSSTNQQINFCDSCNEGFYLPQGIIYSKTKCKKCDDNCFECYSNKDISICQICDKNFELQNNECIKKEEGNKRNYDNIKGESNENKEEK